MKITDIPFKICRKINVFITKRYFKKNLFLEDTASKIEYNKENNIINDLNYKDDTWNYIKDLVIYLDYIYQKKNFYLNDNIIERKRYSIDNDIIKIESLKEKNNWICFFYKPERKNYKLEYEFISYTDLEEIQIAFKCENLGERYRFMIHNNREAVFEAVHRGVFYLDLFKKEYIIEKGVKYKVTLIVDANNYQYYIDGKLIFSIKENGSLIKGDDIIIIFYNKHSKDGIKVDFTSCHISY